MNRYSLIKKLIDNKYYLTIDDIVELIDYMVIMKKISFDQGEELNLLAIKAYEPLEIKEGE